MKCYKFVQKNFHFICTLRNSISIIFCFQIYKNAFNSLGDGLTALCLFFHCLSFVFPA